MFQRVLQTPAQLTAGKREDGNRYAGRVWVDKSVYRDGDVAVLNNSGEPGSTFQVELKEDEEFQIIKDHAMNAIPAIESIYKKPFSDESMMEWMNIAVYHHERWDGTGYPEGKKEKEIPLSARICAIADTYDGITSWKPYKKQQTTREEAINIIRKESGKQFDPYLVDVFRACAIEL